MCNLDKVVHLRGYRYSSCRQKFHQVLAAPCFCGTDLNGKAKKMLLCVDKTVQIFRSKKKVGTPMLLGPPLSGLENNGDIEKVQTPSEVPVIPEVQEATEYDPLPIQNSQSSTRPSISSNNGDKEKVQTPSEVPVMPEVQEPTENDSLPHQNSVSSTRPPISLETVENRGKEPITICGLFPTKSPMSRDATEASLQMEASTASKPAHVARCGCYPRLISSDSVAREKMGIKKPSEPDEKTSNTTNVTKSPAASRRNSQSNISNRSKSPAASRRNSQTSKISKRTKSPSDSRRSSQSKTSKRGKSPAGSRRSSLSNKSNRSKSPASLRRNSQTTKISKPNKSPADSKISPQTKISKRGKSPAGSKRNSQSNISNHSTTPAVLRRNSQTTRSPADSKRSSQTKICKCDKSLTGSRRNSQSNISNSNKSPAVLRRNSQTTKSPVDSKRSSQTKICKCDKSPAGSRRNSQSNISNRSKSSGASRRTSQTSKISNPTKSPAASSRNSPAKNSKSPGDSRRNSQTKITKSPTPSKTFLLTELSRTLKSPPTSGTNSLKENNSQATPPNKVMSPRAKSVAVPAQSSLTQKFNQSVGAQESLMNESKNKSKPINFNNKQNGKPKEPFKSCNCRVVPEKTLVSETNLSCKCCESTKILFSNKGKPNITQNPRQTPKITSKPMPKPMPKQMPKPTPKSNKNQKPPVEEKALVKASPKRKKFTPAKASGKTKVLPGGLTGSPNVSTDDDGIWFECNLPFRVNIPFPLCMQNFFGFQGISLNNTDPKNGNLKAIMPATNEFQSETPGGCNKNTCPKRKLGRRGNKICPCETATQTGEEENDPLLACLEQIKDKLQNLSPQVQSVQAKPCVCFLAEKGTNVREKTTKRSSLSLDSPEDGERSESANGKNKKSRDSSISKDPDMPFLRNASECRASEAGLPNTEPKSKRRFSNGGHCNAAPMTPTYMRQPHVFPTQMHYHPFPRWNYPMYHPQCLKSAQPPSFLSNWQGQPLGNCISYRSLINGEQEKKNCINHMAYPKHPQENPFMEPPGNIIPSLKDETPGSDRSVSGHSVDLWEADRSMMKSNFVKKAPEESTYHKGVSQCHTSPGNNLSNAKISQRSIMKRPSNLGVKLSSTQKKTSSKCISFKMNDSDQESYSNGSSRPKHSNNSKSTVPRREIINTDHSDMSETSSIKIYHQNSDSLDSLRGSREIKNCESYIRETKPIDNLRLGVDDSDELPIGKKTSIIKNGMPSTRKNNNSHINDSERVHQRAESGMEKLERTAKQCSKFKEAMPIITELCIRKKRSLSVPDTRRYDSQNLFLRQHDNEERSPRFVKQLRRGRKSPGRSTKIYLLKDPLVTTITKYELDSSQSKVCGTPDDKLRKKALSLPGEINEPRNDPISNHGKPNQPMVLVPFRVEKSELVNAQRNPWNKIQLTLAVARPPKKPRFSHRRPILRTPSRYTPHRSASGQEFPQEYSTNPNRKATNLGSRPCEYYCYNTTGWQSCQRECRAPTVKPSFGNNSQAEPSSSRNHVRPQEKSPYINSPQCQPSCFFKSAEGLMKSCQKQDCRNSLTYLKSKSKSSTSQWSSRIPTTALKSGLPRTGPQRSGPSTLRAKENKMQTKKSSGSSIIPSKTNNSIGKKRKIPNKKPPSNMVQALNREVVEKSSPMYCNCTPPDQRSIASIESEDRPKTSDRAIQKDHFQNGKRSSYEDNSLTSCGSLRSQYSTTSNQSRNREELQAKYLKVQSSNSSVGYTKAYSGTSFESRSNCYCSPVASKESSLYRNSRDPDWKEAVLEEAHPSYTRIKNPSKESDLSPTINRRSSYTTLAKDYREGDDPASQSDTKKVTKESSRISKKTPQECLCDPNYQSPDEEEPNPTGRGQRRKTDEDFYNSGSQADCRCGLNAQKRVHNSSQPGNSSQAHGSHSRVIASCLPNCSDSCSFKKRTHQAKDNARTNNKKAPETVTLMQPRRFRSTESTQRDKDAIENREDMDTKNTILIETRIPCDRKNLMQTCGRPPCNFHRLQYSGVPPVVEQRNMYMRPPLPQIDPRRSHPNDEDYLIDPRDHLPSLASAPVMGNPYPMPMMNAFHHTCGPYPSINLHGAPCNPFSCPQILKNNIRSMPKGFYEDTLQKYNITRMDSDFQPPTLRSDILHQLNGAPDRQFSNHLNRPIVMKSSGYNQHHMPPPNSFQAQPSHSMFGTHQNVKLEGYDFSEYQI